MEKLKDILRTAIQWIDSFGLWSKIKEWLEPKGTGDSDSDNQ